jgi:phage terminase large subunit
LRIRIPNEWEPRGYQLPVWTYFEKGGKRAALVWHRRAGKDSISLNLTAAAALQRVGVYWHMAPTHRQVRKIVWDGIDRAGRRMINQAFPVPIRAKTNDQEMKIELKNGSIWQCVGSDNYDSLVGANPIGVVFSEYSLANPSSWDFIRPILAENGGWALFIYTPRGRNHGARLYEMAKHSEGWFAELLTVEDTKVIGPDVIESERSEMEKLYGSLDDANAVINQEYFCSFDAALRGAYYGKLLERADKDRRICSVPYDPRHPVTTAWDLGIGDATAIWFVQQVGREVRVIDYYESSGVGLDHYAKALKERDYVYGDHVFPHDAEHSELITGTTRIKALKGLGIKGRALPRYDVDDGIQAVRMLLPRCVFDRVKCERGLDALRHYQKEWDENRQMFKDKPLHDWASHAADAFRYLAHGLKDAPPGTAHRPAVAATDYAMFGD